MKKTDRLTDREQETIIRILENGDCAEVKRRTDGGITIYEVKKNKAC